MQPEANGREPLFTNSTPTGRAIDHPARAAASVRERCENHVRWRVWNRPNVEVDRGAQHRSQTGEEA